jgi:ABC-type Mn2+/Zn2+ transport system ATPase subunit
LLFYVGAGKTTLVELLAQRAKSGTTTGSISFSANQPRVGFVPQQDVLSPLLTVHETLLFAARLRLPENIPDKEKEQRVEDVIEQLKLTTVRNSRIGGLDKRGISGGEMRRVSIGVELIAAPDVLILDEPTSGASGTVLFLNVSSYSLRCRLGLILRAQRRQRPAHDRAQRGEADGSHCIDSSA